MKDQIIENIKSVLKRPLEKERLVYLISQIRKYIERDEETSNKWNRLRYWCDWVFHTRMDRVFAKKVLFEMEDFLIKNPEIAFEWSEFNLKFISFYQLRYEFNRFFKSIGLRNPFENWEQWVEVCKYLTDILRDCPLAKDEGAVREFSFIEMRPNPSASEYQIHYRVVYDGTRPAHEHFVSIRPEAEGVFITRKQE